MHTQTDNIVPLPIPIGGGGIKTALHRLVLPDVQTLNPVHSLLRQAEVLTGYVSQL